MHLFVMIKNLAFCLSSIICQLLLSPCIIVAPLCVLFGFVMNDDDVELLLGSIA